MVEKPLNLKTMNYQRFNRHEAYTPEIMTMIRETITMVDNKAIETGQSIFNELTNMLYGLYDGYYHWGLVKAAWNFGFEDGHLIYDNIQGIQRVTEMYIQLYGESETQV